VAAPALIVIWMLASELPSPGTVAMTNATHDALGPDSEVRAEPAPEGDLLSVAKLAHASGVVRVTWDAEEHRRARVLCYVPTLERWIDREVLFSVSDPEPERGRTLGFLVASIFIDAGVVALPPSPAPSAKPEVARESASAETSEAPRARSKSRSALGAAAQFTGPGTATAFGAWLALERSLGSAPFWLGGSFQARFGSVPEAQATSRFLALGLQATWLPWQPFASSWVGVRTAVLAAQLSLAHLSDDDAGDPERKSRFLATFERVGHGRYDFTPGSALTVDLGAEFSSGKTNVFLRQRQVATWPLLVPTLRVGVNSTF
jgi:hypothetical protein